MQSFGDNQYLIKLELATCSERTVIRLCSVSTLSVRLGNGGDTAVSYFGFNQAQQNRELATAAENPIGSARSDADF
ncbi:hypothetical protein M8494_21900 [Serratia ureilytica]